MMKLLIWWHKWRACRLALKSRAIADRYDCGYHLLMQMSSYRGAREGLMHHIKWLQAHDPAFPIEGVAKKQ